MPLIPFKITHTLTHTLTYTVPWGSSTDPLNLFLSTISVCVCVCACAYTVKDILCTVVYEDTDVCVQVCVTWGRQRRLEIDLAVMRGWGDWSELWKNKHTHTHTHTHTLQYKLSESLWGEKSFVVWLQQMEELCQHGCLSGPLQHAHTLTQTHTHTHTHENTHTHTKLSLSQRLIKEQYVIDSSWDLLWPWTLMCICVNCLFKHTQAHTHAHTHTQL